MNQYRVSNIQRATVNGRRVKLFTVWENGIHYGQFSAPFRTPNKRLLETMHEQQYFANLGEHPSLPPSIS